MWYRDAKTLVFWEGITGFRALARLRKPVTISRKSAYEHQAIEIAPTVRVQLDHALDAMDDFLTPVSTKVKRSPDIKPSLQEGQISQPAATGSEIHSPDEALRALKEQPDLGTVSSVLRYLAAEADKKDGFSLMTIDPRCGNIAYQLVNTTIPDYWRVIGSTGLQARQLVRCLRNPCGIGTIVTRLRALMADCRQKKPVGNTSDPSFNLEDSLGVLDVVLRGDRCVTQTWTDVQSHAKNATQGQMIWKDFIMHIASGRILSLAAEAEDVLKERKSSHPTSWLANGNEYASWLGRNIAGLLRETKEPATAAIDICVKSLTLGYTGELGPCVLRLPLTRQIASSAP